MGGCSHDGSQNKIRLRTEQQRLIEMDERRRALDEKRLTCHVWNLTCFVAHLPWLCISSGDGQHEEPHGVEFVFLGMGSPEVRKTKGWSQNKKKNKEKQVWAESTGAGSSNAFLG